MMTVVATFSIQPGKEADFERFFAELAAQVRASEKGCVLYALNRSRADGSAYVVVERYADNAALALHSQSPHFQEAFPKFGNFLAGPPRIEMFDEVG